MDRHKKNVQIYDRLVQAYAARFMDLALYKETFDALLEHLPQNARVIEFGCGPGNVIKYLLSQRKDLVITGTDLSPAMIGEAKKQNPGVDFQVMDLCNAADLKEKFDGVIAAFSIPYVSYEDAEKLVSNAHELLDPGGCFYLSCMEGPPSRSGFFRTSFTGEDEMYINYYQREQLEDWLLNSSFKIIRFETRDYRETDGSITKDLFYTAVRI